MNPPRPRPSIAASAATRPLAAVLAAIFALSTPATMLAQQTGWQPDENGAGVRYLIQLDDSQIELWSRTGELNCRIDPQVAGLVTEVQLLAGSGELPRQMPAGAMVRGLDGERIDPADRLSLKPPAFGYPTTEPAPPAGGTPSGSTLGSAFQDFGNQAAANVDAAGRQLGGQLANQFDSAAGAASRTLFDAAAGAARVPPPSTRIPSTNPTAATGLSPARPSTDPLPGGGFANDPQTRLTAAGTRPNTDPTGRGPEPSGYDPGWDNGLSGQSAANASPTRTPAAAPPLGGFGRPLAGFESPSGNPAAGNPTGDRSYAETTRGSERTTEYDPNLTRDEALQLPPGGYTYDKYGYPIDRDRFRLDGQGYRLDADGQRLARSDTRYVQPPAARTEPPTQWPQRQPERYADTRQPTDAWTRETDPRDRPTYDPAAPSRRYEDDRRYQDDRRYTEDRGGQDDRRYDSTGNQYAGTRYPTDQYPSGSTNPWDEPNRRPADRLARDDANYRSASDRLAGDRPQTAMLPVGSTAYANNRDTELEGRDDYRPTEAPRNMPSRAAPSLPPIATMPPPVTSESLTRTSKTNPSFYSHQFLASVLIFSFVFNVYLLHLLKGLRQRYRDIVAARREATSAVPT